MYSEKEGYNYTTDGETGDAFRARSVVLTDDKKTLVSRIKY